MSIKLGNGKWAVKVGKLLSYKTIGQRYFNTEFDFARSSTSTKVNKDGYIEDIAADIPRIDFTDSEEGALVTESASTNLITYPKSFSSSYWTKSGASVVGDSSTAQGFDAPKVDGSGYLEKEAYKLVEDTSSGNHSAYKSGLTVTSGNTYTFSVYAKKGERSEVRLTPSNPVTASVFDLDGGTIVSGDGNIEALANGWYRCSVIYTANSTNSDLYIQPSVSGSPTYQGDGTSGVYIAYAQYEENGYASSLMLPTTEGSITSRVADACSGAGDSLLLNDVNSSGVIFAHINRICSMSVRQISISDGANEWARIYFYTDGRISGSVKANGHLGGNIVVNAEFTFPRLLDFKGDLKIAYRWNNGLFDIWIAGEKLGEEDNSSPVYNLIFQENTLDSAQFSAGDVNSDFFYGKIKSFGIFDYLNDEEMAALTYQEPLPLPLSIEAPAVEEEDDNESVASGGYYYYNGEPGFDGIGLINL